MVVPYWLTVAVPRGFVRGLTVGLLWGVLAAYLAGLVVAPIGVAASVALIRRARRERRPWQGPARVLMLCASCLLGAALLETGAAAYRAWVYRLPDLPTRFADRAPKG